MSSITSSSEAFTQAEPCLICGKHNGCHWYGMDMVWCVNTEDTWGPEGDRDDGGSFHLFDRRCRCGQTHPTTERYRQRRRQGSTLPAYLAGGTASNGSTTTPDQTEAAWVAPVSFDQEALPPFPTAALPPPLRDFVEAVATFSQTPTDLAGMLGLAVLALCAGRRVWVNPYGGYAEPACLFVAVAMPSGSRKSSVFDAMMAPVLAYEKAENARLAPLISAARTAIDIAQKRLELLKTKAAKAEGDEAEIASGDAQDAASKLAELVGTEPVPVELWMQDATPEAVGILMANQAGSLAACSDEGGIFEMIAGRYSSGVGNLDVYLKGHAGTEVRVRRVGRAPVSIPHPALTTVLAVQPDVIAGLASKPGFRGRGLIGRFLYSMPASNLGTRRAKAPPIPDGIRAAYAASVQSLLALPLHLNADNEVVRHRLRFSPEAARALIEFHDWLEPQLAPDAELGSFTDWSGKLVGAIARIAGCLHLAEGDPSKALYEEVRAETVMRARSLARYLILHARRAYGQMDADPAIEDARYLQDRIREKGVESFAQQEAWQWTKGRFGRAEPLKAALAVLVERGFIRERVTGRPEGRAGRPAAPIYEVCPAEKYGD